MYSASDLRKGLKVEIDGEPWVITDFDFCKPGKGTALYRCKLKNMITGNTMDRTYRSGDKFEKPDLMEKEMYYSYPEGDFFVFSDAETYEELRVSKETLGESAAFMIEDSLCSILLFNGMALEVTLPVFIEKEIVETEPGARGDTATNVTKPAKIDNGYEIQVPIFINTGDIIKIDTRTGQYSERVKRHKDKVDTLSHLRLQETKARLRQRAGLIAAVRKYFDTNDFIEIDTPVLIPAPAPEEYIEGIPAADGFLRTSPELQMKIMLCATSGSDAAADYKKIYQIGPCFRHGEHGRRHRSEFTMLEWYEAEIGYMQLAEFTTGLLRFAAQELSNKETLEYQGELIDLSLPPQIITVRDAFKKYAGLELEDIAANPDLDFDEIMVSQVEPNLGRGRISYLIDYPADRAALARLKPGQPDVAERWELYIAGLELANAYRELTDPVEQRQRFEQACEERSKNGLISYPLADDFFQALDSGMPECSGAALGVDRLIMIFTDSSDIGQVRTF